MRIAIYARVSTDKQAEQSESIPDQIARIQAWANKHDYEVVRVFKELGASAYEDRRPIFSEMIEWIKRDEPPIDSIVVHSLSRFYRDNLKRTICERDLEKYGVRVLSLTQPLPDDENAAHLFKSIIGAFDEHMSRENSKHVSRCMRANAEQGFFNGSHAPFGYKAIVTDIPSRAGFKRRLAVDPEEAAVAREIFELSLHGTAGMPMGVKKIATYLNTKGVLRRGRKWTIGYLQMLLRSTTYIGKLVTFKYDSKKRRIRPESEWVTTTVPAIIDEELFEAVQRGLTDRAPNRGSERNVPNSGVLTGLLHCGYCKSRMLIITGKSGKYEYYQCGTRHREGINLCKCPNVRKDKIEKAVLNTVAETVLETDRLKEIVVQLRQKLQKQAKSDAPRLRTARKEITSTEAKLEVLYEHLATGAISMDTTLEEHIQRLQRRAKVLSEEVNSLRQRKRLPLKEFGDSQIEAFAEEIRQKFTGELTRSIKPYVQSVVGRVTLKGNNVTIVGNNLDTVSAISKFRTGRAPVLVPSHVAEWRRPRSRTEPLGAVRLAARQKCGSAQ